jgi:G3E family GTPase
VPADAEPLPITVLTGFLGSGKTTLLQRAVRTPAFADTAVLINELGTIGLDHHLVETVDGPILELPGGCLCCQIREDLAVTLRDLLERRADGRVKPFARLVIETTGLADPAPILYTLGADPGLDGDVRLAAVTATVDAVTGAATIARFPEAARQVAVADRLLITKTDLAAPTAELRAALTALNDRAVVIDDPATADPADLFGPTGVPSAPPPLAEGEHSHGLMSHTIVLGKPCDRLQFAKALGALAQERGEDLLRVKGLVGFADRPDRPAVIQGAQHAIDAPVWLDQWPNGARLSWLVFIVHEIPRNLILERFAFADPRPWPTLGAARPLTLQKRSA